MEVACLLRPECESSQKEFQENMNGGRPSPYCVKFSRLGIERQKFRDADAVSKKTPLQRSINIYCKDIPATVVNGNGEELEQLRASNTYGVAFKVFRKVIELRGYIKSSRIGIRTASTEWWRPEARNMRHEAIPI